MPVLHDVHCGLMPPIQHHNCKDVPYLVTRAEVVQLPCGEENGLREEKVVKLLNSTIALATQLAISLLQSSTVHSGYWEAVKVL